MGYNEDLLPLADQIDIVFKLEMTPELNIILKKYGKETLLQRNSKVEFSKLNKESVKRVLLNLSKNYVNSLLDLYFSEEGLFMFISNILIDLSKNYINDEASKYRKGL